MPFSFSNSLAQYSSNLLSKSSPPKWVSPLIDKTVNFDFSRCKTDTSKVPPPKSKTKMFLVSLKWLFKPYAIAAAVGSLINLKTFNPAIIPAFFVAFFCSSLKYAGTVITASVTFFPTKS